MSAAADVSPGAPAQIEPSENRLREVDEQARKLEREQILERLPEWLTLDENDDVVPTEGWQPCPVCETHGYVQPKFPQSSEHERCYNCKGWGEVMTGSLVDGKDTTMCTVCNGNGFETKAEREAREARERQG